MTKLQSDLLNQLKELELTMFRLGLWSEVAPAPERLNSTEPFCIDTLDLHEWLQWIFIPKLQELLQDGLFMGLPNSSNISGLAEVIYKDRLQEIQDLLVILQEIDKLLNSFEMQSIQ